VTHRGLSTAVTFATGYTVDGTPDWAHLAGSPTLVLFMAGARLESATESLISAGRSAHTPAAVVEAGTWEHQRVVEATLATVAAQAREAGIGSPALLVVGDVVSLRARLPSLAAGASQPSEVAPKRAEAVHE
jgi:uroporphyrin-III C-methyltransferase